MYLFDFLKTAVTTLWRPRELSTPIVYLGVGCTNQIDGAPRSLCSRRIIRGYASFASVILGITTATSFHSALAVGLPDLITVEVPVVEDAGVVAVLTAPNNGGAPTFLLSSRATGEFDHNFMRFDLRVLPRDVIITSAELQLRVSKFENPGTPHNMELGLVEEPWTEGDRFINGSISSFAINIENEPDITWIGTEQSTDKTGDVRFPAKQIVQDWLDGVHVNFGLAIRGITTNTGDVLADAREGDVAPRLIVSYEVPERDGAVSDLGDAPDSSNHHGLNNTAYPSDGTLGQFPTVRDPLLGMSTGPYHINPTLEGYLGDYVSHELEADMLLDEDIANNILLNIDSGVLTDIADEDHGDDGWRNRNVDFAHCESELLQVRISRDEDANVLDTMYLNIWFDGNRDGDWADSGQCWQKGGGAAMSQEWIVQDAPIDMNAISPGGYIDLNFQSQIVLNRSRLQPSWVRFILSDEPIVPIGQSPDPWPDGQAPAGGFGYGETEDYVFRPSPAWDTASRLRLTHNSWLSTDNPGWRNDWFTYEVRLHNLGNETISAHFESTLDPHMSLEGTGDHADFDLGYGFVSEWDYIPDLFSDTGGVFPMDGYAFSNRYILRNHYYKNLDDEYYLNHDDFINEGVGWTGTLEPGAEVKLEFRASGAYNDVASYDDDDEWGPCVQNQTTYPILNLVTAIVNGEDNLQAETVAHVTCPDD